MYNTDRKLSSRTGLTGCWFRTAGAVAALLMASQLVFPAAGGAAAAKCNAMEPVFLDADAESRTAEFYVSPPDATVTLNFHVHRRRTDLRERFCPKLTPFRLIGSLGPEIIAEVCPASAREISRPYGSPSVAELPIGERSDWLEGVPVDLKGLLPNAVYESLAVAESSGTSSAERLRWKVRVHTGAARPVEVAASGNFDLTTWDPFVLFFRGLHHLGIEKEDVASLDAISWLGADVPVRDPGIVLQVRNPVARSLGGGGEKYGRVMLDLDSSDFGRLALSNFVFTTPDGEKIEDPGGYQDLVSQGVQTTMAPTSLWVSLRSVSPGEYPLALGFRSPDAASNDKRSVVRLLGNVRHHVWLPILVMVIGTLLGRYGGGTLPRLVSTSQLRQRCRDLDDRLLTLQEKRHFLPGFAPGEARELAIQTAWRRVAQARQILFTGLEPSGTLGKPSALLDEAELTVQQIEMGEAKRGRGVREHGSAFGWRSDAEAAFEEFYFRLAEGKGSVEAPDIGSFAKAAICTHPHATSNADGTSSTTGDSGTRENTFRRLLSRIDARLIELRASASGPCDCENWKIRLLERAREAIAWEEAGTRAGVAVRAMLELSNRTLPAERRRNVEAWLERRRDRQIAKTLYCGRDASIVLTDDVKRLEQWVSDLTWRAIQNRMAPSWEVHSGHPFVFTVSQLRLAPDDDTALVRKHAAVVKWTVRRVRLPTLWACLPGPLFRLADTLYLPHLASFWGGERRERGETEGPVLTWFFLRRGTYVLSAAAEHRPTTAKIRERKWLGGKIVRVRLNPEAETQRLVAWRLEVVSYVVIGVACATTLAAAYGPAFGTLQQYIALFVAAASAAGGASFVSARTAERSAGGSAKEPSSDEDREGGGSHGVTARISRMAD